jgi:hypothetical protein
MNTRCAWLALVVSSCLHAAAGTAAAANTTRPGEFMVDPPTLINLGFEWFIDGDDNRNATVAVSYRKTGDSRWLTALPLLRLQGERINNGAQLDVISPTCSPAAFSTSSRIPTKRVLSFGSGWR